ncbi:3-deoxy-manno-octulosonate cytidylyltransferase [Lachnospiraceae bacterium]|nr:3-deoxy-manno-octulosonate cytidylyltransferase [Lachnospiraceae bacterium]
MRYLVMVQARCGSTRLPNKVLKDIAGKTALQWVIERVRRSRHIDEVMVVTSIEKNNLELIRLCVEMNLRVFVGSENDVLDRYYQAAKLIQPEYIVRITADCPFFDWRYLDMAIEQIEDEIDYMAELTESFPDGLDIEIVRWPALKRMWKEARLSSEREHVTMYIKNHPELFKIQNLECPIAGISNKRWTLDQAEDYQLISNIYNYFVSNDKEDFVTEDILEYLRLNPHLEKLNGKITRNEGLAISLASDKEVKSEEWI